MAVGSGRRTSPGGGIGFGRTTRGPGRRRTPTRGTSGALTPRYVKRATGRGGRTEVVTGPGGRAPF